MTDPLIKLRAKRRINMRVQRGSLLSPNALACVDCGHIWVQSGEYHAYHHYAGYVGDNALLVRPLCGPCHRKQHPRVSGPKTRYVLHSIRIEDEVWRQVKASGVSINQMLRKALESWWSETRRVIPASSERAPLLEPGEKKQR